MTSLNLGSSRGVSLLAHEQMQRVSVLCWQGIRSSGWEGKLQGVEPRGAQNQHLPHTPSGLTRPPPQPSSALTVPGSPDPHSPVLRINPVKNSEPRLLLIHQGFKVGVCLNRTYSQNNLGACLASGKSNTKTSFHCETKTQRSY